jgi:hypothetical protein
MARASSPVSGIGWPLATVIQNHNLDEWAGGPTIARHDRGRSRHRL